MATQPPVIAPGRRGGLRLFSREFLKLSYWSISKRRMSPTHVVTMTGSFLRNAVRLLWMTRFSRDRRPVMAIALMEHIGDVVAAEPISRWAKETHPGFRLLWFTQPTQVPLVTSYSSVDTVIPVQCLTEWLLLWGLGLIGLVWDLHVNGRCCLKCNIPVVKDGGVPDLQSYFAFGSLLDVQCLCAGLPKMAAGPRIEPPEEARAAIDAIHLPQRFVAIHCASNDSRKDWPADRWRCLVSRIVEAWDIDVVEVGLRPLVATAGAGRVHDLCGTLSILSTADVIRRAAVFVGVDSGPAHLANAVGTPGVVLLGEYVNFRHYMPYSGGYQDGRNADILYAEGTVAELEVEKVVTALARRLPQ